MTMSRSGLVSLNYWHRSCDLPGWVLDSLFSVGTYEDFQILDSYNGGIHQNVQQCLLDDSSNLTDKHPVNNINIWHCFCWQLYDTLITIQIQFHWKNIYPFFFSTRAWKMDSIHTFCFLTIKIELQGQLTLCIFAAVANWYPKNDNFCSQAKILGPSMCNGLWKHGIFTISVASWAIVWKYSGAIISDLGLLVPCKVLSLNWIHILRHNTVWFLHTVLDILKII